MNVISNLINKLFSSVPVPITASGKMLCHYTLHKSDYWNLVKYRNPIFNNGGYQHASGLYIKSANLADDIAMYKFYYGGMYLFSIRLSTDTVDSIFVFHCADNDTSVYGKSIMHLVSEYNVFSSHPEFSDSDFLSLYMKCMGILFIITRSGMGLVLAEQKRQQDLIYANRKKKHDDAFKKVKTFIEG